jgi:hypothetical protein
MKCLGKINKKTSKIKLLLHLLGNYQLNIENIEHRETQNDNQSKV